MTTAIKKRLESTFLKHLADECQKSILDDLFLETEKPAPQKTAQKSKETALFSASTKEEARDVSNAAF